ncbi:TonB-dependent receptor [Acetobacter malorum]|nr:TonB-dependent receptor [Acetobacter malorum]
MTRRSPPTIPSALIRGSQQTVRRKLALTALLLGTTSALPAFAAKVDSQLHTYKSSATQNRSVSKASAASHSKVRAPRRSTSSEDIQVTQARTAHFHSQPGTVNVMSGKELRELHVESPKEIAAYTPGVTAVNATSGSSPIFSIRGVGLDDYVGTNMGGIGIYLDGVFAPYAALYNGQMLDIENVVVAKGPQGFDMGRSTTGGSVNITSVKPSDKFGGYLDWGYSSYNTSTGKFAVNVPITDKISNRTAFSYTKGDGWQHDLNTNKRYGAQDILAIRNLTKFQIDDKTSALLNIHYTRDRGTPMSPQNTQADAVNGFPVGTIGVSSDAYYNRVNVGQNRVGRNENGGGASLSFERIFDFGVFTSQTAIDLYRRNIYDNYDGESVQVSDYHWNDTYLAQSHDMHLRTNIAKIFHLTVGIYESYDKIDGDYTSSRGFLFDMPEENMTNHFSQQNLSTGVYVNTVTNITHNLDFIASGRFSYDERGFHGGTRDMNGAVTGTPGGTLSYLNTSHNYERFTGRVGLRYTVVPGTYLYGTISNGFKAGTYFAAPVSASQALDYVRPENLIAYEVGVKSSLFKNKLMLEGSLFDYEYHNRQTLFVAEMPGNITSLSLGTISRARTRGGEVSSTIHDVIPNLDLRGSFAYLDAQATSAVNNIGGLPLLSNVNAHSALPFAPRFSWSAVARYGVDINRYRVTLQASYTWKDNMLVALGDPNGQTNKIGSMGLRMEFAPKTSKWSAAVYVDNMLDKHGNVYSFTGSDNSRAQYLQTPRWVGVDLHYNF